jgi:hypothetical protein
MWNLFKFFRRDELKVPPSEARIYQFPRIRQIRCTAPTEQETVKRMKAEQQGLIDMDRETK